MTDERFTNDDSTTAAEALLREWVRVLAHTPQHRLEYEINEIYNKTGQYLSRLESGRES